MTWQLGFSRMSDPRKNKVGVIISSMIYSQKSQSVIWALCYWYTGLLYLMLAGDYTRICIPGDSEY